MIAEKQFSDHQEPDDQLANKLLTILALDI